MSVEDLTGRRFGRLVVIEYEGMKHFAHSKPHPLWRCICDCGNEKTCYAPSLKSGRCRSCGCLRKETTRRRASTHHDSQTRLYRIYRGMKSRCYNSNDTTFHVYGARGITVCDEWLKDYSVFKEWSLSNGYSDGLSIDRIDCNGPYSPENCRWTDDISQANNTRRNRFITIHGETHTIAEWSRIFNVCYQTFKDWVNADSSEESILNKLDKYMKKKGA